MKNFWKKLKKPIFCLAPMADVTDCAFRQIITKYSRHGGAGGGPDVFWTEFVSADGLAHPVAREKLLVDLKFSKNERPIVAQIFGSNAKNIKSASRLCKELGFDGIDINMGCPDRSIEKQGAGAAMIKNPKLAKKIIQAVKEGGGGLPVSVKTRIGYNPPSPKGFGRAGKNDHLLDEKWIRALLEEDLAALIVHLRTRKEMSSVPAHWELMKEIVAIRNEMKVETLIIGNGDVEDIDDARRKCEESGCDGVMLGRAIFGNPWLFTTSPPAPLQDGLERGASSGVRFIEERLGVMLEHTKLFEKLLGGQKNFAIMKKHYKAYVNGFLGAKELRMKLMEAKNAKEVERISNDFLGKIE
ncbi:tRNA-dihydrouridine synthase [Candidatus Nomurabacteria bacterium]|nr:tRNA-dihydrouridine synthase [Candidatus Nomurabacteria bacterium]